MIKGPSLKSEQVKQSHLGSPERTGVLAENASEQAGSPEY